MDIPLHIKQDNKKDIAIHFVINEMSDMQKILLTAIFTDDPVDNIVSILILRFVNLTPDRTFHLVNVFFINQSPKTSMREIKKFCHITAAKQIDTSLIGKEDSLVPMCFITEDSSWQTTRQIFKVEIGRGSVIAEEGEQKCSPAATNRNQLNSHLPGEERIMI